MSGAVNWMSGAGPSNRLASVMVRLALALKVSSEAEIGRLTLSAALGVGNEISVDSGAFSKSASVMRPFGLVA